MLIGGKLYQVWLHGPLNHGSVKILTLLDSWKIKQELDILIIFRNILIEPKFKKGLVNTLITQGLLNTKETYY